MISQRGLNDTSSLLYEFYFQSLIPNSLHMLYERVNHFFTVIYNTEKA